MLMTVISKGHVIAKPSYCWANKAIHWTKLDDALPKNPSSDLIISCKRSPSQIAFNSELQWSDKIGRHLHFVWCHQKYSKSMKKCCVKTECQVATRRYPNCWTPLLQVWETFSKHEICLSISIIHIGWWPACRAVLSTLYPGPWPGWFLYP